MQLNLLLVLKLSKSDILNNLEVTQTILSYYTGIYLSPKIQYPRRLFLSYIDI